ncbi:MAG: ABC transporter permease [Oscillospiraceae bacterium]|jgi:hypothetical protein|nr:ABC transporter permease [Oscillospiraceae bacterium]
MVIYLRKHIIIIAVNVLLIIGFAICLLVSATMKSSLRSQQAAQTWAGQSGERFAQLSAFFPQTAAFNEEGVYSLRHSLDNALLGASLESTPGNTLYTDAWSGSGNTTVSIVGERGSANAKVIGVGGDFFLFHPLNLRDGSYLSPNDVMKDRVVLDEELAWRLFGSSRIAGFEVMINLKPFVIAGVISRESDFASSKAYAESRESDSISSTAFTDGGGLFMSYEALTEMSYGQTSITCYEIVLSDPISGFAKSVLTDAVSVSDVYIVENSERFSLLNSFAAIRAFGERSMQTSAITLPYWENAARYTEDWLALLLALSLLVIAFPLVCAITYSVIGIRRLVAYIKMTVKRLIDKKDKRAYDRYLFEHNGR